ncbi:MFS transporter [Microbacterium horticulturae]|uniref:MFS transporter n=1 Tax=Microbacterium horticulturae TaxID=3028316 RepID=A0ABY8BTA6_9MICO|nr:MFS transporter [Microbacterium sp. KACC 23027]WEG07414.1 MFS transporter [Microbacterium sp. KACC 23027]
MTTRHITAPAHDERSARVGWRGWAALMVLTLPVLLVSVDNTVLSFALPEIALDLEPTGIQQLWIIDAYPLVLAALLVTMGTLGDRFGRRRMLLIGATGFAVVSAVSSFAPSAGWLIAGRASMAVFGAMLMPSTLSLLRSIFTDRDQRRLAIAVWAAMFSAGAALGPIVGGLLLEHFAWGSVFLMAVPVLIPLLILAPLLVPESRDPKPGRVDPVSILLSVGMMLPTVYAIKEMAVAGLGGAVVPLLIAGGVFGVLFVRRQLNADEPMLDMGLFRRTAFTGALLVNLLSVLALVGFLFFVAQHLQLIVGLSPMEAGLALVPSLAAMIIAGLLVVPVASRVSPRVVIPVALAFSAAGYIGIALTTGPDTLLPTILASVSLGIGVGAAETVSNELILSAAPADKAGAASAVSETAYEAGTVLGTSIIGGLLTAVYRTSIDLPASLAPALADAARETLAGAMAVAGQVGGAVGDTVRAAAAVAFDQGMSIAAAIGAVLVVAAAVIAATMLGRSRGDTQ